MATLTKEWKMNVSLKKHNKDVALLAYLYRKNLVNTIDAIEYSNRLLGSHRKPIIRRLRRLIGGVTE